MTRIWRAISRTRSSPRRSCRPRSPGCRRHRRFPDLRLRDTPNTGKTRWNVNVLSHELGGSMEGRDSRRAVRVFGVGLVVVLAAGAVAAPGPAGPRGGYGGGGGGGTPTPEPTVTTTPTPTPTPPPPDVTAPSVNSRVGGGQ